MKAFCGKRLGRREKLAQKVGRREIYPLFLPPLNGMDCHTPETYHQPLKMTGLPEGQWQKVIVEFCEPLVVKNLGQTTTH